MRHDPRAMLTHLTARDFRNLEPLSWRPAAGSHLLLGGNGAGKTSLLEAVYALATTRSFRAAQIGDCARHGAGSFHRGRPRVRGAGGRDPGRGDGGAGVGGPAGGGGAGDRPVPATCALMTSADGPDREPAPPEAEERRAVRLLVDEEAVQGRVAELGAELRADYQGLEPILVSVLRGGVVFLADLVRAAAMPCLVDFMAISRFDASEDTGVVRIEKDLELDLSGAHVLVVEDIVDTGLTLTYLLRVLAARGPVSLRVCALLDKRARRIVDVPLSYVGFEVPDVFLVGYGLDLDERERGRRELLAVDDLEAVRADPTLLDLPTRADGAWRPPRA